MNANPPFPGPPCAVLFDLDGVLVDSEPLHLAAWERLFAERGMRPPPRWDAECVGLPGGRAAKLKSLFPERNDLDDLLAEKRGIYLSLVEERGDSLLFGGVADGLSALRERGVPLAVATNNTAPATALSLCATGIENFFQAVVTIELVERGKPSPDLYALAARRLGFEAENCIVVEDSQVGVASGLAAGCFVAAVATTARADGLAAAHALFPDTREALAGILESI